MSGGEWLIRQMPFTQTGAFRTERITIETDTAGGTDPILVDAAQCMTFHYADGRIIIFPWANIVRAEYRPHPEP